MADKKLKSLLNLCALNIKRYDKEVKAYYDRKVAEGKPKMLVLNDVRCKIVSRIFAIINSGIPYVNTQKFAVCSKPHKKSLSSELSDSILSRVSNAVFFKSNVLTLSVNNMSSFLVSHKLWLTFLVYEPLHVWSRTIKSTKLRWKIREDFPKKH